MQTILVHFKLVCKQKVNKWINSSTHRLNNYALSYVLIRCSTMLRSCIKRVLSVRRLLLIWKQNFKCYSEIMRNQITQIMINWHHKQCFWFWSVLLTLWVHWCVISITCHWPINWRMSTIIKFKTSAQTKKPCSLTAETKFLQSIETVI